MVSASETTGPRTFVKKLGDGSELTRQVQSPASEVEALFDGFVEKRAPARPATSGSTARPASPAG